MAAAREIEETVNSGSEPKSGRSGNKAGSGVRSRNATESADSQARPDGESGPSAASKTDSAGATPTSPSAESPKTDTEGEPSLGHTLTAARERRGVSRADVVAETRIPGHYIEMMESADYGLISDQLYLMPFLRRYAAFLNLDGEEVAMRFVREVQRAEVAATPRMSEPLAPHDRRRAPWGRVAVVIVVLSAIVVLYVIASEHHRGESGSHRSALPVAPAPMAAPAPMTAPAPHVAPAPQAAAPAQMPETEVVGAPAAPAAARPQPKAPPPRAPSPSSSTDSNSSDE